MDTVLIVYDDEEIRENLQMSLEALTGLRVVAARDRKRALEKLKAETVDLLVTELKFPRGDGLDLIAFMTEYRPEAPRVVLTGRAVPGGAQWREGLYCLATPFESFQLAAVVREGLTRRREAAAMSLCPLLPLVVQARKTCRLEAIAGDGGKGYFYFENGGLNEAHCGELRGEAAALAMLAWGTVRIRFSRLPPRRAGRRLSRSLNSLIQELARRQAPADSPRGAGSPPPVVVPPPVRRFPPAEKTRLRDSLQDHLPLFRGVNGYQVVGVVSDEGEILVADAAESDRQPSLPFLGAILYHIFGAARAAAGRVGMQDCLGLSVHTPGGIVLISGTRASAETGLYLFGVMAAAGNWFFLKTQLDKTAVEVLGPLA